MISKKIKTNFSVDYCVNNFTQFQKLIKELGWELTSIKFNNDEPVEFEIYKEKE